MRSEYEINQELKELLADYNANCQNMTSAEIGAHNAEVKALRAELQAVLTNGAKPCPDCLEMPLGINQPRFYEVGCSCPEKQSKGQFIEEAVENWNNGVYFARPPR